MGSGPGAGRHGRSSGARAPGRAAGASREGQPPSPAEVARAGLAPQQLRLEGTHQRLERGMPGHGRDARALRVGASGVSGRRRGPTTTAGGRWTRSLSPRLEPTPRTQGAKTAPRATRHPRPHTSPAHGWLPDCWPSVAPHLQGRCGVGPQTSIVGQHGGQVARLRVLLHVEALDELALEAAWPLLQVGGQRAMSAGAKPGLRRRPG
jgi:hypothetical protein